MTFNELRTTIRTPVFSTYQVQRVFSTEDEYKINISLSRLMRQGKLVRIKKGLFHFPDREVDELTLANFIYQPSYVSLESALQLYGMIPEEVMVVMSVTPITSKKFETVVGRFLYSKIQSTLFFGYDKIRDSNSSALFYHLAKPEKALLDYIYIRQIKDLEAARIEASEIDKDLLRKFAGEFPAWVQSVIKEQL